MKLSSRSSLADVAAAVAGALGRAGIRAVLTGGACATLYTEGEYQSFDLDFILQSAATRRKLDTVMASIGYRRAGNQYEHPKTAFIVEFPAGPLGIGVDIEIQPVTRAIGGVRVKTLSATDSCRDRLAAFYDWNDRQSLPAAVEIALRRRVDLRKIRTWGANEGRRGPQAPLPVSGYSRSNSGSPCRSARSGSRRAQSESRQPAS